jgi:hypothetical protein
MLRMHLRCKVLRAGGLWLDQPVADALHLCILQLSADGIWIHGCCIRDAADLQRCCSICKDTQARRTAAPCGLHPLFPAAAQKCPAADSAQQPSYDPALQPPSLARPPACARQQITSCVSFNRGGCISRCGSATAAGTTDCRSRTPQHAGADSHICSRTQINMTGGPCTTLQHLAGCWEGKAREVQDVALPRGSLCISINQMWSSSHRRSNGERLQPVQSAV